MGKTNESLDFETPKNSLTHKCYQKIKAKKPSPKKKKLSNKKYIRNSCNFST